MDPARRKTAVAWLSVGSNVSLVVMKVVVGLLVGSVSVLSEAIHSGVDLLAAVIALLAVKASSKPADAKHPFGHGKFENLSGTIEALLIFLAAAWIIYEAVHKFLVPSKIDMPYWGVIVMGISAAANMAVSSLLFKVGRDTDSMALEADGWHLRTDVYTSIGVMVGLGLIWLSHWVLDWHVEWLDPAVAIAVALLIIRAAYDLTIRSTRDLMDMQLPAHELKWIADQLMDFRPTVRGFHQMRTRKAGPHRFIEFHIFVDAKMTVEDSHRLAHGIAAKIQDHFHHSSVTVHVEPCSGKCRDMCEKGCLLTHAQRQALRDQNALPPHDEKKDERQ